MIKINRFLSFQIPRQYKSYGLKTSQSSSSSSTTSLQMSSSTSLSAMGTATSTGEEGFMVLINELIACDEFEDIATLKVFFLLWRLFP